MTGESWPIWPEHTVSGVRLLIVLALMYVGATVIFRIVRMTRRPPE